MLRSNSICMLSKELYHMMFSDENKYEKMPNKTYPWLKCTIRIKNPLSSITGALNRCHDGRSDVLVAVAIGCDMLAMKSRGDDFLTYSRR